MKKKSKQIGMIILLVIVGYLFLSLFTDKEYIVQKKNKFSIKPNISFSFSTGSKGSDFSNSLGIIIENDKEYFNYSQNEFIISSNSSKQIYLSIHT